MLRAIRRYLGLRKDNLPWLFLSERQRRLTRFAVNYLVNRTAEAAGSLIFIHIAFGTFVGMRWRTIQEWLGHRSIEMTVRSSMDFGEGLIRPDVSQEASQHSVN